MKKKHILCAKTQKISIFQNQGGANAPPARPPNDVPAISVMNVKKHKFVFNINHPDSIQNISKKFRSRHYFQGVSHPDQISIYMYIYLF